MRHTNFLIKKASYFNNVKVLGKSSKMSVINHTVCIVPVHCVCRFARPHLTNWTLACLRASGAAAADPLRQRFRTSWRKCFSRCFRLWTTVLITAKSIVCRMQLKGGPFLRCSHRESKHLRHSLRTLRRRRMAGMNDCLRAPRFRSICPQWKYRACEKNS